MSELYGPLARVTLAFGLWVIPLAPLVAAAYALYTRLAAVISPGAKKKGDAIATNASTAAVLGAALAFGWTAFQTLRLSQLDDKERFFLEHVFRMVRFGQLDVAMDLAFDPLTSVVALAVSGVGFLLLVVARARGAALAARTSFFTWSSLL